MRVAIARPLFDWSSLEDSPSLASLRDQMARRLGKVVPGLGQHLAGDATALRAQKKRDAAEQRAETAAGLPQPSGGRKEYLDDAGNVTEVYQWFGYKLHLLVDVKHEVALAYTVTAPSAGDGETLPAVLVKAEANLPEGRIKTLAYDKAADSNDVHELLAAARIKPLIQTRALWKEEPERACLRNDVEPPHNATTPSPRGRGG